MLDDFIKVKEKLGKPGVYLKVASDIFKLQKMTRNQYLRS